MRILFLISFLLLSSLSFAEFAVDQEALKKQLEVIQNLQREIDVLSECEPNGRTSNCEDINGDKFPVSVLSESKAQELFDEFVSHKEIPFGFPWDGCYARAHAMAHIMDKKGILSGKVFVLAKPGEVLTVETPKGTIEWNYHVAPVIKVRKGFRTVEMVMDPSLFDRPVTKEEWATVMTKKTPAGSMYLTNRFSMTPVSPTNAAKYNVEDELFMDVSLKGYTEALQMMENK